MVDGAHTLEEVERSADIVRSRFGRAPDVAVILGTGLGALASRVSVEASIDYAEIPGFPLSTVESHAGRLLCGTLAGKTVVAMQGRFHRYEGYSLAQVTFPVRVLRALGARTLVVSNACGGMRVLGVSIITDQCLPDALEPASVEKIIAVASRAEPNLTTLVCGVLERV
jgi:purine-nucleoside phosphorylase